MQFLKIGIVLRVICTVGILMYGAIPLAFAIEGCPGTPAQEVQTEAAAVPVFQVGFSPRGEAQAMLINNIENAQEFIFIAANIFSNRLIGEALVTAARRGVRVYIVADGKAAKDNEKENSLLGALASQGVMVRLNSKYNTFQHTFMVIDGGTLETGNFNYTQAAAEQNAGNILILHNVPSIADPYIAEWKRLWDESSNLEAN